MYRITQESMSDGKLYFTGVQSTRYWTNNVEDAAHYSHKKLAESMLLTVKRLYLCNPVNEVKIEEVLIAGMTAEERQMAESVAMHEPGRER